MLFYCPVLLSVSRRSTRTEMKGIAVVVVVVVVLAIMWLHQGYGQEPGLFHIHTCRSGGPENYFPWMSKLLGPIILGSPGIYIYL